MNEWLKWGAGIVVALVAYAYSQDRKRIDALERAHHDHEAEMKAVQVGVATDRANQAALEDRMGELSTSLGENTKAVSHLANQLAGLMAELRMMVNRK